MEHCFYHCILLIYSAAKLQLCLQWTYLLTYFNRTVKSHTNKGLQKHWPSWTICSAIAERPRCWVRYSFGQKWKTATGRQYLTDIIGLSSTTVT